MNYRIVTLLLTWSLLVIPAAKADQPVPVDSDDEDHRAIYLGNEAVLVVAGETKILFDPFFHNNYGIYQLVPEKIRADIFAGKPPFDGVTAVFVSHAHGDHFTADDMMRYLKDWPKVRLVAPSQAVRSLQTEPGYQEVESRVTGVSLKLGDPVWQQRLGNLEIEAIRIPHSGWPERASVENIVFRVLIDDKSSVSHLGDADANPGHYHQYRDHWRQQATEVAFPPYWFKGNPAGKDILHNQMNVKRAIGIHVPVVVPPQLQDSGEEYFSKPGEEINFRNP